MTTRAQGIAVIMILALVSAIIASHSVGNFPKSGTYAPFFSLMMWLSLLPYSAHLEWLSSIQLLGIAHFLLCLLLSIHLIFKTKRAWEISAALLLILVIANVLYYMTNWKFGVQYYGLGYVLVTLFLNTAFATIVAWLLLLARLDQKDSARLFLAHGTTLIWLSWVSLPMMGVVG